MTINVSDIKPKKLRFYAQDQIAGIGKGGSVFIITFLDNRIFYTFREPMKIIHLLGRDILLVNHKGECLVLSFEKNEIIHLDGMDSPVCSLSALPKDKVLTGHKDGTVRIWALTSKWQQKIKAHSGPVISLAADHWGRIYSAGGDHNLKQWDLEKGSVAAAVFPNEKITHIKPYPGEKILALSETSKIYILDFKGQKKTSVLSPFSNRFSGTNIYGDGRILTIFNVFGKTPSPFENYLALISRDKKNFDFQILNGHTQKTLDCLAMGSRIITCGRESPFEHSMRIWGTDYNVRTALSKLEIWGG